VNHKLEEVFGVRSKPVLSYVERPQVDDKFLAGLRTDKQLVVYGASKQGKTSLVAKFLPYERNIVVQISPGSSVLDIYSAILRQSGVKILSETTGSEKSDTNLSIGTNVKAQIPLLATAETQVGIESSSSIQRTAKYDEVEFNLGLPQDVSDLLNRISRDRPAILENFHYLSDDRQRQLAFDLRTFQELGQRFVILGVWREKNRLAQFNGDLLDRIVEIPVEPWEKSDFQRVADKGAPYLGIEFSESIVRTCIDASFSSVGVFQELLKETCAGAGITKTDNNGARIQNEDFVRTAIQKKAEDYASRHQRALESIAAGKISTRGKGGVQPLFLPYYLVRVILAGAADFAAGGIGRATIKKRIEDIHHRPRSITHFDLDKLLASLAGLQNRKGISPPILDYDQTTKRLQIVDSTFYFFLHNADGEQILSQIPNPLNEWT
jgi:hypothetical protein